MSSKSSPSLMTAVRALAVSPYLAVLWSFSGVGARCIAHAVSHRDDGGLIIVGAVATAFAIGMSGIVIKLVVLRDKASASHLRGKSPPLAETLRVAYLGVVANTIPIMAGVILSEPSIKIFIAAVLSIGITMMAIMFAAKVVMNVFGEQ